MSDDDREHQDVFRPRARLVSMLGEHLISDQAVGLVELVKNAYDADATEVSVDLLELADADRTTVVVDDNGQGMTLEDVRLKWLSPAVDHKDRAKRDGRRSPKGRLPIGEKGVGRFAVQQLGRTVEMVTRAQGEPEVVLRIDWDAFDDGDVFLDALPVDVRSRPPERFTGDRTGTWIRVSGARSQWSEKLLRKIHRSLRRLQSPAVIEKVAKGRAAPFRVRLRCPDYPEYENIDPGDILGKAHYEFRAIVNDDASCDFDYECKHPACARRTKSEHVPRLPVAADELPAGSPRCGNFWVNLFVWDRTKEYLQKTDTSKKELDALCGVSLYRDGLRVLPYGDSGDDWLFLDKERVQHPADRIGNDQVVGFVEFDQTSNLELRDKTNREGLIENGAFIDLRSLTQAAVRQFLKCWKNDRPPAREPKAGQRSGDIDGARTVATAIHDSASDEVKVPIPRGAVPSDAGQAAGCDAASPTEGDSAVAVVSQRKATEILLDHLAATEDSIRNRDRKLETFIQLSATGLAAERVVHEFGRQVRAASDAVDGLRKVARGYDPARRSLAALEACLETLQSEFRVLAPYEMTGPAQRSRLISIEETAKLVLRLNRPQIQEAHIETSVVGRNWRVRIKPTPLIQILDNLVNNASYWVATRAEGSPRRLAVLLDGDAGSILVADSGPGVDEEVLPHLFEPFYSTKGGGKGLGLYISSELASRLGAKLRLAGDDDAGRVPDWATGAVFVLQLDSATCVADDATGEDDDG